MRTKDDILIDARRDITDEQYKTTKANWLEYRKIEVLIDIRDIHSQALVALDRIGESLEQLK